MSLRSLAKEWPAQSTQRSSHIAATKNACSSRSILTSPTLCSSIHVVTQVSRFCGLRASAHRAAGVVHLARAPPGGTAGLVSSPLAGLAVRSWLKTDARAGARTHDLRGHSVAELVRPQAVGPWVLPRRLRGSVARDPRSRLGQLATRPSGSSILQRAAVNAACERVPTTYLVSLATVRREGHTQACVGVAP